MMYSFFVLLGVAYYGISELLVFVSAFVVPTVPFFRPSTTVRRHHRGNDDPVVVVGGGVGGLAIAARLAAASSARVTLLEKNSYTGGRCGSFAVELSAEGISFRHERGPSLLLLPHLYEQLFQDVAQKSALDYGLILQPCLPAYSIVFDDGEWIDLGFPASAASPALERRYNESRCTMNRWEDQGAQKWDHYLDLCRSYLECGLPNFIEERLDLTSLPSFLWAATQNFFQAWPLKPHSDVLDSIFYSNKMRALASFQDLYVGLEPYRNDRFPAGGVGHSTAPAVFGLLAAIELHPTAALSGVYAPMGGFQAVHDSIHRLALDQGVQIRSNATVVRVTDEGVYYQDTNDAENTNGPHPLKFLPADVVVINADLPYAQQSLFEKEDVPPKYDWDDQMYRYSSGVLAFHWSIDQSLDELNTHTVFLSAANRTNAQQSWESVRSSPSERWKSFLSQGNDTPFNFYVHRASQTDPTAAPKGMDSILVLVPCPTLQRNEKNSKLPKSEALANYRIEQCTEDVINRVRAAVFHRLSVLPSLSDLANHILHEVVDTPVTYAEQYHVAAGTPFGLSHGLQQLSVFRPPRPFRQKRKEEPSNVVYCGASTRPGNGVPLVLTSAKLAADQVLRKLKTK